ncbi:outer membrane protein assembly factor BamB family protein [Croceimicrobium hydrocarbonivorans]|uniref:PQQ-binding-like beta-propeller repeat protein n=1 Tax=Croceimicrobium hydrocarbonivorans TaxID=2761580 RepID=A0A7H0VE21_9FLAO|nr:PQQ-binding-like beta-propeller repeat protein [Croceimicrobium hydrocarbonivorans]QNR23969.1 PQQ-binding-like beta-propeller repeat protein [Croceimicrobium hydrocarbonivorans]
MKLIPNNNSPRISPLFLVLLCLMLVTCKDKEPPKPQLKPAYEILWQRPIVPDPELYFSLSINPFLYKGMVIVSSEYTMEGVESPLMFLDSADGHIIDLWSDFIDGAVPYIDECASSEGEFLVLNTQRSVDCVNLETRSRQWASLISRNHPYNYIYKGFVYTTIQYNGDDGAAVLRSPLDHEDWQTVYPFTRTDFYHPFFSALGFGETEDGHEIVVWKNRSSSGGIKNQTDIFAYDLTADSLMWRNRDFNEFGGILPLQVDNQRVYGAVESRVFCLDLMTGDSIWTNDFSGIVSKPKLYNFDQGMMYLSDYKVYLKGGGPELVILHKSDGSLFRTNDELPDGIEDRVTYFEGKLFMSTQELVIVDLLTGDLLNDPNAMLRTFGNIYSKIVIDPDRRVMYFHNGRTLFCVKIPEDL